jgi:NAD(P)-dependent dehydrogenase (short-subunit alcohol dehydrogenase family)
VRLLNKVAFITGGTSGIGLATARLFLAEGAKVVITGRNQATLDQVKLELAGAVRVIKADVRDISALTEALAEAVGAFDQLDTVFANAGIGGSSFLGTTALADFANIVDVNLTGVFFTVQAAVPHMKDGGAVILNGSIQASLGMPGRAAYAASKAGVRAMTRVLASELAPRGIRVNQVTPGGTRTPIWSIRAPEPDQRTALENKIAKTIPLGRLAEADDVARAVLYLASDDSVNLTASEIVVDGGAIGAPRGAAIFRET